VRTTVTLDEDVVAALRQLARERGVSFKEVLNAMVRAGITAARVPSQRYRLKARPLGVRPGIDLDKANRLAAQLEDEELVRKYELGK
jgi:Ribbon-helix-helix protein, copG family